MPAQRLRVTHRLSSAVGLDVLVHCPRCGWASEHFGALLEFHRRWQHRTRTDCAAAAGVSLALWSMWESGARLPSEDSLAAIERALRLTADETEELAAAAGLRPLAVTRNYQPRSAREG